MATSNIFSSVVCIKSELEADEPRYPYCNLLTQEELQGCLVTSVEQTPDEMRDTIRQQRELARRELAALLSIAKSTPKVKRGVKNPAYGMNWRRFMQRKEELTAKSLLNEELNHDDIASLQRKGIYPFTVAVQARRFATLVAERGGRCYLARHPERGELWVFTQERPADFTTEEERYYPVLRSDGKGFNACREVIEQRNVRRYEHKTTWHASFTYRGVLSKRVVQWFGIGDSANAAPMEQVRHINFAMDTDWFIDLTKVIGNRGFISIKACSEREALGILMASYPKMSNYSVWPVEDDREFYLDDSGMHETDRDPNDDTDTDFMGSESEQAFYAEFDQTWSDALQ